MILIKCLNFCLRFGTSSLFFTLLITNRDIPASWQHMNSKCKKEFPGSDDSEMLLKASEMGMFG